MPLSKRLILAKRAGKEKFVGWNSGVHTFDGENPGYMLDSRYNAI